MKRQLRRKDRVMDAGKALELLINGEYGVLATVDSRQVPYAVPLSYVYCDNCLYFHSAREGRKVDNINAGYQVSFSVVGKTKPVYDKVFTTYYESVTVAGEAREVTDDAEKKEALIMLCRKYLPGYMDKAAESIEMSLSRTAVFKVVITNISGKEKKPEK